MKYSAHQGKTVYPQDIQCVWESKNGKGSIYVGNLQASENLSTLKKHGIKGVLTAAKGINLKHPKSQIPYHLQIPGQDHENFDLSPYFDKSIDFIDNVLRSTNILVHCMAGVSRSVTLVLAYLMKHEKLGYQEAFQAVRRKRRIINPNRGFIRQLQQFEKELNSGAKALRRSYDNFQAREARNSLQKSYNYESSKSYLKNSVKRIVPQAHQETYNRYSTLPISEQNIELERKYETGKYQGYQSIKRIKNQADPYPYAKQFNNTFSTYNEASKQLDQKIANIRKKYMQASDFLNRDDRNNYSLYNTKPYFQQRQRTNANENEGENKYTSKLKGLLSSTNQNSRNYRLASYGAYLNPRKVQNYMYYNY